MRAFSFHPEYGLTDEFRSRVVKYVVVNRATQQEAAERFRVSQSSVSTWIRDADVTAMLQQGECK